MKPMLCSSMTLVEARDAVRSDDWYVEYKYDGIRAYIKGGQLWDRRGANITHKFPEFVGLSDIKDTLDGEIIAQSGEFNDVSGRVHMKDAFQIRLVSKKSPAKFVIFDAPEEKGSIEYRKAHIAFMNLPEWAEQGVFKDATEAFDELWGVVIDEGREGLVLKRKQSFYEEGKRSPSWVKVKSFVETVAEFTKFEVNPRGVTIETADGRRVVVNGSQAVAIQEHIKRNGSVTCEIQYLPQKDSTAWRFPSFRGIVVNDDR